MIAKLNVTKDTVSKYLDTIHNNFHSHERVLLEGLGEILSEYIGLYDTPRYSSKLLESGLKRDNWVFNNKESISDLRIVYSGLEADYSWWEFSDDYRTNHSPDRDYAYFQETGIDNVANSKLAKSRFFVKRGTVEKSADIFEHTRKEYLRILQQK